MDAAVRSKIWEKNNVDRKFTAKQLVELAKGHFESEDQNLLTANKDLFTDTNTITMFMFSTHYQ